MKIFLYTGTLANDGKRLQSVISSHIPEDLTEVYDSNRELTKALHTPGENPDVVVLLAGDLEELQKILALKDVLLTTRVILVLPDRHKETIAKGHTLFPRFISYMDNDYSEIGDVLKKISAGSVNNGNNT
jgi:hypothetical protein